MWEVHPKGTWACKPSNDIFLSRAVEAQSPPHGKSEFWCGQVPTPRGSPAPPQTPPLRKMSYNMQFEIYNFALWPNAHKWGNFCEERRANSFNLLKIID
jgi:hypothetical protein